VTTPGPVHYLPIATTLLAAGLAIALLRRHAAKGSRAPHLLWWACGAVTYGTGTALESVITLFGNSVGLTKAWYVAGALLGGYPLAQGSVYLLAPRAVANRLTWVSLPCVVVVAALVLVSPVHGSLLEAHRPSGAVLAWSWVRALTPVINVYALVFLVGGAAASAIRYARAGGAGDGARAAGNAAIACGGLLPGVGGALAKAGAVEPLYVAELVGLLLIAAGFALNVRVPRAKQG
jgi:hypothetical protein